MRIVALLFVLVQTAPAPSGPICEAAPATMMVGEMSHSTEPRPAPAPRHQGTNCDQCPGLCPIQPRCASTATLPAVAAASFQPSINRIALHQAALVHPGAPAEGPFHPPKA